MTTGGTVMVTCGRQLSFLSLTRVFVGSSGTPTLENLFGHCGTQDVVLEELGVDVEVVFHSIGSYFCCKVSVKNVIQLDRVFVLTRVSIHSWLRRLFRYELIRNILRQSEVTYRLLTTCLTVLAGSEENSCGGEQDLIG